MNALPNTDLIDAHVHLWTSDLDSYPIAKNFTVDQMQPPEFLAEELFSHTRPVGVNRVVLIQMSYYASDNRYMLDQMTKHPQVFSGVGIVDHHSKSLEADIKRLAQHQVRGLRIHARGEEASTWDHDDGMLALWKLCGEYDLAVCPLIQPNDVSVIDKLCQRFPETTVVVDHMARIGIKNPASSEQVYQLCGLAKHPKVYVKTSAFYAMGSPPLYQAVLPTIQRLVECFGARRLMWASDCPFQVVGGHDYQSSIDVIRKGCTFLSTSDRLAILRDTAHDVFFK
jgi:predicted TIM-barrel fold metal-dependent hydrolase